MKYAYKIAVAAVGCVLGAGFLSGQELLRFFGAYGALCYVGVGVAALFFYLTVSTVLLMAHDSGEISTERLVLSFDSRVARVAITAFEIVFLFLIFVLMVAASGSLLEGLLGLPALYTGIGFALLSGTLSLFGVKGLVRIFSSLVPLLVLATLVLSLGVGVGGGWSPPGPATGGARFVASALAYVSFNIVCSIPVLAPVGKHAPSRASIRLGTALASLALSAIAVVILLSLSARHSLWSEDLPMLTLAVSLGRVEGALYGALLFGGIFSTGLTATTALHTHIARGKRLRVPAVSLIMLLIAVLAVCVAQSGFRSLVGFFYPVFGYLGMLPLALLFYHAALRRKERRGDKKREEKGKSGGKDVHTA